MEETPVAKVTDAAYQAGGILKHPIGGAEEVRKVPDGRNVNLLMSDSDASEITEGINNARELDVLEWKEAWSYTSNDLGKDGMALNGYALTPKGFEMAYQREMAKRQDATNRVVALLTAGLFATATSQALVAIYSVEGSARMVAGGGAIVVLIVVVVFLYWLDFL